MLLREMPVVTGCLSRWRVAVCLVGGKVIAKEAGGRPHQRMKALAAYRAV